MFIRTSPIFLFNHVESKHQILKTSPRSSEAIVGLNEERPLLSRQARPARLPDIQRSFLSGVGSADELKSCRCAAHQIIQNLVEFRRARRNKM